MKYLLLLNLICTILISSTHAQEDIEELRSLLSFVPDTSEVRQTKISYVDFRAMELARSGSGVQIPESWNELIESNGADLNSLYMSIISGITPSQLILRGFPSGIEDWKQTVGFDFFDVNQILSYGEATQHTDILIGDFDFDAVGRALSSLNYTFEQRDEFLLWCGDDGCKGSAETDIQNANLGFPFGGSLGRNQPILTFENAIASSVLLPDLLLLQDVVANVYDSLIDNPSYFVATTAIDPSYQLAQALFVHPDLVLWEERHFRLVDDISPENYEFLTTVALPEYDLLMIADLASATEQVVYLILVYDNIEDADLAASLIPNRIDTMRSSLNRQTYINLFERLGAYEIDTSSMFNENTNKAVATLKIYATPVSSMPEGAFSRFNISSPIYRMIVDMLNQRDFEWLATSPIIGSE